MRRFLLCLLAVGGLLLLPFVVGGIHRAVANGDARPLDPQTESFPGQVSVAGPGAEFEDDAPPFMVADEDRGEAGDDDRGERRRPRHHRRPHHDHHGHGPHHDMHGHRGPPGPPPGHHPAMRRFDEIIERLAKIEAKLGIDDPAPARRERRPRPEARDGERGEAGQYRPGGPLPEEEMGRPREERVAEMRQRMEDARRRFRDMDDRVKKLEAEIERLKAADRGP